MIIFIFLTIGGTVHEGRYAQWSAVHLMWEEVRESWAGQQAWLIFPLISNYLPSASVCWTPDPALCVWQWTTLEKALSLWTPCEKRRHKWHTKQDIRMRLGQMAQQIRVFAMEPKDLSSGFRTLKVEGQNRLRQVVLCRTPPLTPPIAKIKKHKKLQKRLECGMHSANDQWLTGWVVSSGMIIGRPRIKAPRARWKEV